MQMGWRSVSGAFSEHSRQKMTVIAIQLSPARYGQKDLNTFMMFCGAKLCDGIPLMPSDVLFSADSAVVLHCSRFAYDFMCRLDQYGKMFS